MKRSGVYLNSISIVFLFISRSATEFISTLFPFYFFYFIQRSGVYFNPFSIVFPYLFHEAQRSLFLFYFQFGTLYFVLGTLYK